MSYVKYWRVISIRAFREAWSWLFVNWVRALLTSGITSTVTFLAKVHFGAAGDGNSYLLGLGSVCFGSVLTFLVVLGAKILGVPADLHAELAEEVKILSEEVAGSEERRTPKINVLGLEQPPDAPDNAYYLLVQNKSEEVALQGCLARIEKLADANDNAVLTQWVLRTENQVNGRPEGRFNLDPGQTKRVLLCNRSGTSGMPFRIVAAQSKAKKLQSGNYTIDIRITCSSGGKPVDAQVAINGSKVSFVRGTSEHSLG
jgi:hypothetical protein